MKYLYLKCEYGNKLGDDGDDDSYIDDKTVNPGKPRSETYVSFSKINDSVSGHIDQWNPIITHFRYCGNIGVPYIILVHGSVVYRLYETINICG